MSGSLRVLEDQELKPGISCQVVLDSDNHRIYFNVTNQRRVELEVRFDWEKQDNLRQLTSSDFMNYQLFQNAQKQENENSLASQNLLDRTNGLGRTRQKSGEDVQCAVLEILDKTCAHQFEYRYKVFTTSTLTTLPAVTRTIESTEIRPGVFVRALWYGGLRQMHQVVCNERDLNLRLVLVWSAFDNMKVLVGASGEIFVPAKEEAVYAVLTPDSKDKPWRYRYSFKVVVNDHLTEPILVNELATLHRDMEAHQAALTQAVSIAMNTNIDDVEVTMNGLSGDVLDSICESAKCTYLDLSFCNYENKTMPVRLRSTGLKRLSTVLGSHALQFEPNNTVSSSGVRGGAVDAWVAGVFAALAERPELILRCFVTQNITSSARFTLSLLNTLGLRKQQSVDDYYPYVPLEGFPFVRGQGNLQWPALLAKAIAKVCGSYTCLLTGQMSTLMNLITGCPVNHIAIRAMDTNALWAKLCDYTQKQYVMAASIDRSDVVSTGLLSKNVYTILGALPQSSSTSPRLLLLKHYSQTNNWTGAWGHGSAIWDQEVASEFKALEPVARSMQGNGSLFCMTIEDVVAHFRYIGVCYSLVDWQEVRIPFHLNNNVHENTQNNNNTSAEHLLTKRTQTSCFFLQVYATTPISSAVHQAMQLNEGISPNNVDLPVGVLIAAVKVKPGVDPLQPPLDEQGQVDYNNAYTILNIVADSSLLTSAYIQTDILTIEPGTYIVLPYTIVKKHQTQATNLTMALHTTSTIQVLHMQQTPSFTNKLLIESIKKHGVPVICNVPGLILYDWCAKKSAYFAVEMTPEFQKATGRTGIYFGHQLTVAENVETVSGNQVQVALRVGECVLLNIALVVQLQKAWKYKHKWEFTYIEDA